MEQAEPRIGSHYIGKWNWGAFLLTGFWLFWHRRAKLAIWFWIFWIAPFALLFSGAAVARLGLYGPLLWIFFLSRFAFFALALAINITWT